MPERPRVDQPRFINRATLCPVCLKPCDLGAQDLLPFYPAYLDPFDTLQAYGGFYHRACFYTLGDYERMVQAWHRALQAGSRQDCLDLQRDFGAWRDPRGLALHLYPRFAQWIFRTAAELEQFETVLKRYHAAPDKRHYGATVGPFEVRPAANHPVMSLRWEMPLSGVLTFARDQEPALRGALPARRFKRNSLELGGILHRVSPRSVAWTGGDLDPTVDWDLSDAMLTRASLRASAEGPRLEVETRQLRVVPIWDDEVAALLPWLQTHRAALQATLTR